MRSAWAIALESIAAPPAGRFRVEHPLRGVLSIKATPAVEPLLVDVKMAAATLCVSRSTIYQLIWDGELEPVRIGRSVRFTPTQLEQFVSRRASDACPGDTSV